MIATVPTIRMMAPARREDRRTVAVLLVVCGALDAVAAAFLLLGGSLPLPLQILAAAASHGTAVLLLTGLARARPGRPWLGVAALLAVPLLGAAVAITTIFTSGRNSIEKGHHRRRRRRPAPTRPELEHLADSLSPCDALDCGDGDQRRAALSVLAQRTDPEAIALLRRAAAGRDPDLALSAALVLDEISERAERQAEPLGAAAPDSAYGVREPVEVRHGVR